MGQLQKNHGTYDIGYYDDYKGRINIFQYDVTGQMRYACTLIDAWPVNVADLQGDWSSDSLHRLMVTFMYRQYRDEQEGYYDGLLNNIQDTTYNDGAAQIPKDQSPTTESDNEPLDTPEEPDEG